jgi:hypothetical protein
MGHRTRVEMLLFAEHLVTCPACRLQFVGIYQSILNSGVGDNPTDTDPGIGPLGYDPGGGPPGV